MISLSVIRFSPSRRPTRHWPRAPGCDRRGTTALEFALLAPVLFSLILGSIEFGRFLWTVEALNYSVEEAARCGLVNPDGKCASGPAVQAFAASAAPQLGFSASNFTVNTAATCGYQVVGSFNFKFIASGLIPLSPTLTAQACFPNN